MTLFEKIQERIIDGFTISFTREINQLIVSINYESKSGNFWRKQSHLPLQDHFYEARIVDCIEWSITEIQKEINA